MSDIICALAMIGLNRQVHTAQTTAWSRNLAVIGLLILFHLFSDNCEAFTLGNLMDMAGVCFSLLRLLGG